MECVAWGFYTWVVFLKPPLLFLRFTPSILLRRVEVYKDIKSYHFPVCITREFSLPCLASSHASRPTSKSLRPLIDHVSRHSVACMLLQCDTE